MFFHTQKSQKQNSPKTSTDLWWWVDWSARRGKSSSCKTMEFGISSRKLSDCRTRQLRPWLWLYVAAPSCQRHREKREHVVRVLRVAGWRKPGSI